MRLTSLLTITILFVAGCSSDASVEASEQDAFWSNLESLCGNAYRGEMTAGNDADTSFAAAEMVMHVRECNDDTIKIPFHVGDDRSRTWVVTRTDSGLRLKHDHRHEDGSEDDVTQYGGDTQDAGSATVQHFHADAYTADLLPAAASNVWTMEVHPDSVFAYALRREAEGRHFQVDFNLTEPVDAPPAPWGHE